MSIQTPKLTLGWSIEAHQARRSSSKLALIKAFNLLGHLFFLTIVLSELLFLSVKCLWQNHTLLLRHSSPLVEWLVVYVSMFDSPKTGFLFLSSYMSSLQLYSLYYLVIVRQCWHSGTVALVVQFWPDARH